MTFWVTIFLELPKANRLNDIIYQQILRIQQKNEVADEFRGLYISDEEIAAVLYNTYPAIDDDGRIQTLIERIAEIETDRCDLSLHGAGTGYEV